MKINIVPYNDEWPLLFKTIKKEIKKSIVNNEVIIEHIGSTSSKPSKYIVLWYEVIITANFIERTWVTCF